MPAVPVACGVPVLTAVWVPTTVCEGAGVPPPGQPPAGAGMMSPCRWCAGTAFWLIVICTYGLLGELVLWQMVTLRPLVTVA